MKQVGTNGSTPPVLPCEYHSHRLARLEERENARDVEDGALLRNVIAEVSRTRDETKTDLRVLKTTVQLIADRVAELNEAVRHMPNSVPPPAWEEGPDTGIMDRPQLVASRSVIKQSAKRYRAQAMVAVVVAVAGAVAALAQAFSR